MSNEAKFITKIVVWSVVGIIALILLFGSWSSVEYGNVGFVKRFGNLKSEVLNPGLHFKLPLVDSVVQIDTRVGKVEADASAASKDAQKVTAKVAVNYNIDSGKAYSVLTEVGKEYKDRTISPAIQESVKAVTAQYVATDLLDKRSEVATKTFELLDSKLKKYGVTIRDVSIVNLDFSDAFNQAIEQKQAAQQNAIKAKNDLERIKVEAEARIVKEKAEAEANILRAKADAESLRLKKSTATPESIKLKELEIQERAIEKWDGKLPSVTSGATPFISIPTGK